MPKIQNPKKPTTADRSLESQLKDRFAPTQQSDPANDPPADKKVQDKVASKEEVKSGTVLIEVPLSAEAMLHEFPVHVDFKLTPPQSTSLRRLVLALDRQQATLKNGARVVNLNTAVKWLIEQLG